MADPELARDVADTAAKGGVGMGLLLLLQKLAERWRPTRAPEQSRALDRRVERLEERFDERLEKALANHAAALKADSRRITRLETVVEIKLGLAPPADDKEEVG